MSAVHHEEEVHTGPVKNPKQFLLIVFFGFVVPVFIIIGLVKYVTSADTTGAGSTQTEAAKAERLQKVGLVEIRDANRPLRTGEEVYTAQCSTCHAAGVAGAPTFKDNAAWGPRLKQGFDTLVHSALSGKGAMAPQGGGDFNDIEIARGVAYMANAAGANFPMPDKPAAAADAAPAASAPPVAAAATPAAAPAATPDAASAAPAASSDAGKALYEQTCAVCHGTGVAGAPKFGDKAAWGPFVAEGMDAMVKKATQGIGAMPPKGGSTASDADFKAAIQYMVDHAK